MDIGTAIAIAMLDEMIEAGEGIIRRTPGETCYASGRVQGLREARAAITGASGVATMPEDRSDADRSLIGRMRDDLTPGFGRLTAPIS